MGNIVPSATEKSADGHFLLQNEWSAIVTKRQLGKGKFLKSYACQRDPRGHGKVGAGAAGSATAAEDDAAAARSSDSLFVCKVYIKREERGNDTQRRIGVAREQLGQLGRAFTLQRQPNLLPYQRWEGSPKMGAAYLFRQHLAHSLYERCHTRPFLTRSEKMWLIYQLLRALAQCHARGIAHGDIKSENVMVTAWGWLMLTDFALFKPTFIPDDHPADFHYFFESGTRRRCYIAPERFVRERDLLEKSGDSMQHAHMSGTRQITAADVDARTTAHSLFGANADLAVIMKPAAQSESGLAAIALPLDAALPAGCVAVWPSDMALTPSMDIFAAGCVIAELVQDGEPILELSSLLRYKSTTAFDPLSANTVQSAFASVDPTGRVLALVSAMIQRDPNARASAQQYLDACTLRAPDSAALPAAPAAAAHPASHLKPFFPASFPLVFDFMSHMLRPQFQGADARILAVTAHYSELVRAITGGCCDPLGERLFLHRLQIEPATSVALATFSLRADDAPSSVDALNDACPASASGTAARAGTIDGAAAAAAAVAALAGATPPPTCVDDALLSFGVNFSVDVQRTAEELRSLQWEWGWFDATQWGHDFLDLPPDAAAAARSNYTANMSDIHRPWRLVAAATTTEPTAAGAQAHGAPPAAPQVSRASTSGSIAEPVTAATATATATHAPAAGSTTRSLPPSSTRTRVSAAGRVQELLAASDKLVEALLSAEPGASMSLADVAGSAAAAPQALLPAAPVPGGARCLTDEETAALDTRAVEVILTMLTSSLRLVSNPRTKVTALLLISRLSALADDDCRLQRLVPYIITQFSDASPLVRAHAVACLTGVFESVRTIPASEEALFSQYIHQHMSRAAADTDMYVQLAIVECLPRLALVARRFLDITAWKAQLASMSKSIHASTSAAVAAPGSGTPHVAKPVGAPSPILSGGTGMSTSLSQLSLSSAPPASSLSAASPGSALSPGGSSGDGAMSAGTPQPAGVMASTATRTLADTSVRVRSTYDAELAAMHRRVKTQMERWLNHGLPPVASIISPALPDTRLPGTRLDAARGGGGSDGGGGGGVALLDFAALHDFVRCWQTLPAHADMQHLRRALLEQSSELSAFFGRAMMECEVFPHIATYMNDMVCTNALHTMLWPTWLQLVPMLEEWAKQSAASGQKQFLEAIMQQLSAWLQRSPIVASDWLLRATLLKRVVALATVAGPETAREHLQWVVDASLVNANEPVVHEALLTLSHLLRMRMLPSRLGEEYVRTYAPLLLHPSGWIRRGALRFVVTVWMLLRWPRAYAATAAAMNPLLQAVRGDYLWLRVAALLDASPRLPAASCRRQLEAALSVSLLPALPRVVYEQEVDRLAVGALLHGGSGSSVADDRSAAERTSFSSSHSRPGAAHTGTYGSTPSAALGVSASSRRSSGGSELGGGVFRSALGDFVLAAPSGGASDPESRDFSDGEADDAQGDSPREPRASGVAAASGRRSRVLSPAAAATASSPSSVGAGRHADAGAHSHEFLTLLEAMHMSGKGGAYAAVPYAPPRMREEEAHTYQLGLLQQYMSAICGPHRVSIQSAGTLRAAAEEHVAALTVQAATAPLSHAARRAANATATARQAARTAAVELRVGAELEARRVLANARLPSLPYAPDEVRGIPVRSIVVPDQRFVSVYPPLPSSVHAATPHPQREVRGGSSRTLPAEGARSLHAVVDGVVPLALSPRHPQYALVVAALAAAGGEAATTWSIPAASHWAAASPPLPMDYIAYCTALLQQPAAPQVGAALSHALLGGAAPASHGHGRRVTALLPLPIPRALQPRVSLAQAAHAVAGALAGAQAGRAADARFVAAVGGDALHSLFTRNLVQRAESLQSSTHVSHALFSVWLRALWRRSGRAARRLYVSHGIWDPMLSTGGSANAEVSTSIFASTTAALAYDATLLSSDDEQDDARVYGGALAAGVPTLAAAATVGGGGSALRRGSEDVLDSSWVTVSPTLGGAELSASLASGARMAAIDEHMPSARGSVDMEHGAEAGGAHTDIDVDMFMPDTLHEASASGWRMAYDAEVSAPLLGASRPSQDTRVMIASAPAAFCTAAQSAISTSDGSWYASRINALAASSGVQLPSAAMATSERGGGGGGGGGGGSGGVNIQSATMSSRQEDDRRRAARAAQVRMRVQLAQPGVGTRTGTEDGALTSAAGDDVKLHRLGGATYNRLVNGSRQQPPSVDAAAGVPGQAGVAGARSARVADGSFVCDAYAAEAVVQAQGAYTIGTAAPTAATARSTVVSENAARGGSNSVSALGSAGAGAPMVAASTQITIIPQYTGAPALSSAGLGSTGSTPALTTGASSSAVARSRASFMALSQSVPPQSAGRAGGGGTLSSGAPTPAALVSSGGGGKDNRDYLAPDAAVSLARRVSALQVPPLPPQLGSLQKPSEPPAPIIAHALRVVVGFVTPDDACSVAPGIGSGRMGINVNAGVLPGVALALDEHPTQHDSLMAAVREEEDVMPDLAPVAFFSAGGDVDMVPEVGNRVPPVMTAAGGRGVSGGSAPVVVPPPAWPPSATSARGARATAGAPRPVAASRLPPPPPPPSGGRAARVVDESDDDAERSVSEGEASEDEEGDASGAEGVDARGMDTGAVMVPVPLALPAEEDLKRPATVGDGTGYMGSAAVSFAGVERGWHADMVVGSHIGTPLSAAFELTVESGTIAVDRVRADAHAIAAGEVGRLGAANDPALRALLGADSTSSERGGSAGAGRDAARGPTSTTGAGEATDPYWGSRPTGILISTCAEHRGAVNAIAACQDHSFFATASDDGTVKVWSTRQVDVEMPSSITYTGHLQEARTGDAMRSITHNRNKVLDVVVCDNSQSIASASAAGSVHVVRVDLSGARGGASSGTARRGSYFESDDATAAAAAARYRGGTHGSFVTGTSRYARTGSAGDAASEGSQRGSWYDMDAELDAPRVSAGGVAHAHIKSGEGAAMLRRFVFDAAEGAATVVRHYQNATQSVLAVAMANGVVHGCDLRSRVEAWAHRLPAALGCITAMEVCQHATSLVIGTDRGVIVVVDTRFDIILRAWRHSACSPILSLMPYVTLNVREGGPASPQPFMFGVFASPAGVPGLPVARQLAAAVTTGNGEVSFWNLETGACTRILRNLPQRIHASDAYNMPYLTSIRIVGGRLAARDAVWLHSTSVGALSSLRRKATARWARQHPFRLAASSLLDRQQASTPVRALLCPLPTPSTAGTLAGALAGDDPAALGYIASGAQVGMFGSASGGMILGGLRGAGAKRRTNTPFAVGYGITSSDSQMSPFAALSGDRRKDAGSSGGGHGGGHAGSASTQRGGAQRGSAPNAAADGSDSVTLGYLYGGSHLEGLPVWMLTAGGDCQVRCWDLDRPRASHTVCGLRPGQVRDGYEGAWIRPQAPSAIHFALDADEDDEADAESEAEDAGGATRDADELAAELEAHDAAASDAVVNEEGVRLPTASHFSFRMPLDGMSNPRKLLGMRHVPRAARVKGVPAARREAARYAYGWQYPHPTRVIFSQPLYNPTQEADVMGKDRVPPSPALLNRGIVPAPTAHESPITSLAWLDMSTRLLLTGCMDGVVKIWK